MNQKAFNYFAWSVYAVSIALPITVWGNSVNWSFTGLSIYQWFPLFGLLAWMIMWTHYVNGAIRIKNPNLHSPRYYSKITSYIVLAALFLHPGLLALGQFQNDQGLPPASYVDYVGSSLQLAVMFGSVSLLIFLSFEFFSRARSIAWVKKCGLWISLSQSVAMLLIFVHALRLGSDLNTGWFYAVWLVYGAILIPCLYIIHAADLATHAKLKN